MPGKNFYELLEVARGARGEEIRDQYRLMLYKYHPDHNQGNEEWAVTQTIHLVEAYRVLTDPQARRHYDFRISHRVREEGSASGIGFLKSRASKDAEKAFQEGLAHYQSEKLPQAAECFRKAFQLDPAFSEAAYNFSLIASWLGNFHAGLEVIDKAIKAAPKDPELSKLKSNIVKTFMSA